MLIRKATQKDLPELMALDREAHELHRRARPDIFKEASPEVIHSHLLKYLERGNAVTFVTDSTPYLLGYVQVEIKDVPEGDFTRATRQGLINSLVVTEGKRRSGIGKKLIDEAERWLLGAGVTHSLLNVWVFNDSAIQFYESLGYCDYSRKMVRDLRGHSVGFRDER